MAKLTMIKLTWLYNLTNLILVNLTIYNLIIITFTMVSWAKITLT